MDIIKDTSNKAIKDNIFSLNNEYFVTSKTSSPYSFILKKTEKISAAIYLLTSDFNDGEPIRYRLRYLSITLIERACALMPASRECLVSTAETIDALRGVLTVSARAGLIHPGLVEILIDELALISTIAQEAFASAPRHGFGVLSGPEYFNVEAFATPTHSKRLSEISDPPNVKDNSQNMSEKELAQDDLGSVQNKRTPHSDIEKDKNDVRKKDRRAVILTILQTKERVTVKELADVIKDCSEKTLQRELLALVAQGVLKKEGERRWSSYSIR